MSLDALAALFYLSWNAIPPTSSLDFCMTIFALCCYMEIILRRVAHRRIVEEKCKLLGKPWMKPKHLAKNRQRLNVDVFQDKFPFLQVCLFFVILGRSLWWQRKAIKGVKPILDSKSKSVSLIFCCHYNNIKSNWQHQINIIQLNTHLVYSCLTPRTQSRTQHN